MGQPPSLKDSKKVASTIVAEIQALPVQNTPNMRAIRRKYSLKLKQEMPEFILDLARELLKTHCHRWVAYELVQSHRAAFQRVAGAELEELGLGMNT